MTYSCLSSFSAFLSPDRADQPSPKPLGGGLMPAIYIFPLLLGCLWIVVLSLFVWMHRPEPTIAEIIRAQETRS